MRKTLAAGAVVLSTLGIAGCLSVDPKVRDQQLSEKCAGYGFQPGTSDFAACKMLVEMRAEQDVQNRMRAVGNAMSAASQPTVQAPTITPPVVVQPVIVQSRPRSCWNGICW